MAGTPLRLPLIEGKDIRFTHLSTEQGLSQSRVDHMLQDRRGFIWIGTYNGLNRYDGYRFKTYKPDPNNPNSLGGLRVSALFEDRSGILWIGVDQGLDRFDPATERFTHFRADPDNPDVPPGTWNISPRIVTGCYGWRPATAWIDWIRPPVDSPTIATIQTIPTV